MAVKEELRCKDCGERKPRREFHGTLSGPNVCRACLANTEWNDDPSWPAFIEQFRPAIETVAAKRTADPELRKDAEQAAWIKLYKLRPEHSHHYDRFKRGEIDAEEFYGRILRYLCNQAINRAIYSAVTNAEYRRLGTGSDRVHEPWPSVEGRDGPASDFDPPAEDAPNVSELVERHIDFRRLVSSRLLTGLQREALVMWAVGYGTAEIGRVLGYKYGNRPLAGSTIRYQRDRALDTLRGRYAA
jgi:DNA-directed RNA polymerase specialized sigma24 family protein